jgi:hypothetical protein
MIEYKPDALVDWIQSPELTWGRKKGDCEDYAALAQKLLRQIGIEGYCLAVILKPAGFSHAVCVFRKDAKLSYFSNAHLIDTEYTSVTEIVSAITGKHTLVGWGIEDFEGHIARIKRGK